MIHYGLLTAEDEWTSEFEVYEFLFSLVRLLKPKVILETGSYKGGATIVMCEAAKQNRVGRVWSCDTNPEMVVESIKRCAEYDAIQVCRAGVEFVQEVKDVDFAYIDSSGDRVEEVRNLQLTPNAVVVLHDSKRPQYRPIWTLKPWKAIWEIETEQGITVFQL